MGRYIDADKLLELYETPKDMPEWEVFRVPIPVIRQNILDMPTADVIILPCPIGTMVYQIRKVKVDSNGLGMNYHYELDVRRAIFDLDLYYQFGKTVFLTEKEAESRLEEMTEEDIKKVLRWS